MKPHILSIRDIDRHDKALYEGLGLIVTVKCPVTGDKNSLTCGRKDFQQWVTGTDAQVAFPYLTADERELLISGTSTDGWDTIYPDK